MATARVRRGRKSQEIAADYFKQSGVEDAEPVPASLPGMDIRKVPCLAPEVKARSDFSPQSWMRQAKKNAPEGLTPIVIMRPNGSGPETVADWPVFLRFEDFVELCKEAGLW